MRIITDARGQPQFVFLLENIDAISGVGQQQRKSINFYSKSLNEVERRIFQKLAKNTGTGILFRSIRFFKDRI